jgi:hypothetical protein
MFDLAAFRFDLQNRDHVMLLALLISFQFELPSLVKDHVKHAFEHVKRGAELPCLRAITSSVV